jgi:hypothetical protein
MAMSADRITPAILRGCLGEPVAALASSSLLKLPDPLLPVAA